MQRSHFFRIIFLFTWIIDVTLFIIVFFGMLGLGHIFVDSWFLIHFFYEPLLLGADLLLIFLIYSFDGLARLKGKLILIYYFITRVVILYYVVFIFLPKTYNPIPFILLIIVILYSFYVTYIKFFAQSK